MAIANQYQFKLLVDWMSRARLAPLEMAMTSLNEMIWTAVMMTTM